MVIPSNGRIVILDDKKSQADPLIRALSKNKVPFTYHTGEATQLPETPYDDVRLLFLDINLTDGVNEEAIKSQLQKTISKIVSPKTPYIAAIWSIRENEYINLISDLFSTKIPLLKPVFQISLAKSDLFSLDPVTGHYEEDEQIDLIREIETRLNTGLNASESFKLLITWENIIQHSSSQVIRQFSNIIDRDNNWNNNLKYVFLKMAYAQLGKNIKNANELKVVRSTFRTLTSSIIDKIENKINLPHNIPESVNVRLANNYYKDIDGRTIRLKWENLDTNVIYIDQVEKGRSKLVEKISGSNDLDTATITSFKNGYRNISPKINAELLINTNNVPELQPGNIYYKTVSGSKKRKLLKTYFDGIDKKRDGQWLHKDISSIWFVELECTPICDYSQNKWLRSRILPGILYPTIFNSLINTEGSFYKEIPPFEYKNQILNLVFDYRLFKSLNLKDDTNIHSQFIFRLKNEVLIDIQARISSHVSRPGIITVI